MQLLAKFKKILNMRFRATLNFRGCDYLSLIFFLYSILNSNLSSYNLENVKLLFACDY